MIYGNILDMNGNEIRNAVIQVLASDPVSPVNGQLWVNSTDWVLRVRLNGVTISLGRIDQTSAPTGNVSLNSQRITSLADPVSDQDAATRAWVLAQLNPRDRKASVRALGTTNVTISSAPSAIGGVTLTSGDRVALVGQSAGAENGIYVFNGAASAMTRATDADSSAEVTTGMEFFVEEGTSAGSKYYLTTANPITLGTTALTFVTDTASGTVNKYSETIGNGSSTQFTVTHNLASEDVTVVIRYASGTKEMILTDWRPTSSNAVRVDFAVAPASNEFRVTVFS